MEHRPKMPDFERMARDAGYRVVVIERLRSNRWLVTLVDGDGHTVLVLAQARPLIGSADVQDLAEFVRLRNPTMGFCSLSAACSAPAHSIPVPNCATGACTSVQRCRQRPPQLPKNLPCAMRWHHRADRCFSMIFKNYSASGGLKPCLRSGKPCGLDQPGAPRHRDG